MRRLVVLLVLCVVVLLPEAGQAAPLPETALSDVQSVDAGVQHSCAVLTSTQVQCWGDGSYGKLGNGTYQTSMVPDTVLAVVGPGPLSGVSQVRGGRDHTCALLTNGQVRCWGANALGQLGADLSSSSYNRPQVVLNSAGTGPLQSAIAIDVGGDTSCAVLASRQLRCWGNNGSGNVGDGTGTHRSRPTVVSNVAGTGPLTGVAEVSVGNAATCARLLSGQARCWGPNGAGQLGDGTRTMRRRPRVVRTAGGQPLAGVSQISVGELLTCARLTSGQVRCWGRNAGGGGLGNGSPVARSVWPVAVRNPAGTGPLRGIARVETGSSGACALTNGGQVRCWGAGDLGQLGNGQTTPTRNPLPVVTLNVDGTGPLLGVDVLSRSYRYACAKVDDAVRCWGYGLSSNLGDGDDVNRSLPVPVTA
jgi:alpha-tubulin suppressor-like RCC1 family protein